MAAVFSAIRGLGAQAAGPGEERKKKKRQSPVNDGSPFGIASSIHEQRRNAMFKGTVLSQAIQIREENSLKPESRI